MIDIVIGDAADVAAIMPIMADAFDPAYGEAWTAAQCLATLVLPDCQLLLARDGDTVCGFAITRWVLDNEELLMIGVAPQHQRQKVGATLLNDIKGRAKAADRTILFLEVRDGNPAYDFYCRSGFTPIGRRKNYYKSTIGLSPDAITMSLDL